MELERQLGRQRTRALWDMAEDAKKSLLSIADQYSIDADYQSGQLTPMHKRRFEADTIKEVETLQQRYDYSSASYLDKKSMADALGSDSYFGGMLDTGTGHIHPMKYVIGLARAAAGERAELFENTRAHGVSRSNGKIVIETSRGKIRANRVLLALNGHHDDLRRELSSHVLPIQSFIGATIPLPESTPVLPGNHAVDDSRFVVRYFRKSADNRLLFGGREAYGSSRPGDIERAIRKQISQIYPALSDIEMTHAWGGNVAITMPRRPYVRELEPGIWTAGGFSGHGVMLSNYVGRMIADCFLGNRDQIKLLQELKIPAFPGGSLLRNPIKVLALTWYAMLDRI